MTMTFVTADTNAGVEGHQQEDGAKKQSERLRPNGAAPLNLTQQSLFPLPGPSHYRLLPCGRRS